MSLGQQELHSEGLGAHMKNNNYCATNFKVIKTQVTLKEDLTKKCA